MSTVQMEQILVVPTKLFHDLGHFQGFSRNVDHYLPTLLDPANTDYRPRGEMEDDPSFKQLIPYVIFRYQNPPSPPLKKGGNASKEETASLVEPYSGTQVFCYTRGKGQGEARLHTLKSIGIGGHISTLDQETHCVYEQGMRRELEEETVIESAYRESQVGLINDDETDVGKVHLGVVHIFDVETPEIRAREAEIADAGFRPIEEILAEIDLYESWSQICLRALFQ